MKSTVMWGLIGLNAVLLFMFTGGFNRTNTVHAQAAFRRPADYVLIPGRVNGASTSLVYIIDATNGKLGAMGYDDSSHQLITMPSIDLNRIFTLAQQQQQQNRGGGY
jgi:hypothetical protein